jgi:aquaporin Z
MPEKAMNKYVTEFVGTFFLVLTIGCSVIGAGAGPLAPLAIGGVLIAMVFAGGHVSGAHYNPAVTLAVFLRGRCPAADVAPYMAAQTAGALLGAGTVKFLKAGAMVLAHQPETLPALAAEFLFTLALAYVVLSVATAKGTAGNSFYGLAIGLTVMAGAFAVGPISGGVFNPAVAVGGAAMGLLQWADLWLYLAAQLCGGAAAALLFKRLNPKDR